MSEKIQRLSAIAFEHLASLGTLALLDAAREEIAHIRATDMTPDEITGLSKEMEARAVSSGKIPADVINQWRRELWNKFMAHVEVPDELKAWADGMTKLFRDPETGKERSTVRCWSNDLPWLTALMVVRYGEACEHWPLSFNDDDIKRAHQWMTMEDVPKAVTQRNQAFVA